MSNKDKLGVKLKDKQKFEYIPIKVVESETLRKPEWMKIKLPHTSSKIDSIKNILRKHNLNSVCEEASCPNLAECFNHGTATFMIMGAICTRRCPFCDVGHGKPLALDPKEPQELALAISEMKLKYVVITSVDRDDLVDGGALHFQKCISEIRAKSPNVKIEILTPDFKGRMQVALDLLTQTPPDVFNHNLETAKDLYTMARPGANYQWSLDLLNSYHKLNPHIPTKSGLMVGLGETNDQIKATIKDLRQHNVSMLTLGQYLQPSKDHLPVKRYVTPDEFKMLKEYALDLGFKEVASGPFVRSSYHADIQAQALV